MITESRKSPWHLLDYIAGYELTLKHTSNVDPYLTSSKVVDQLTSTDLSWELTITSMG